MPGSRTRSPIKLSFDKFSKIIKFPHVVYADSETFVKPIHNPLTPFTFEYQKHEVCSFGLVVFDHNQNIVKNIFYRGKDTDDKFLDTLIFLAEELHQTVERNTKRADLKESDKDRYQQATICHVCEAALGDDKVPDHCHLSGSYRGAAHSQCNLKLRLPFKIPVIFHNLKGFDAHITIKGLRERHFQNITIILQTIEKYISPSLDDLVFLDSLAFLPSSLDTLSRNLPDQLKSKFLLQIFKAEDLPHLLCKGSLPYGYMESWDRFEVAELPPIEMFYSTLNRSCCDAETYSRLKDIWNHFKCQSLGDFHDIYLKTDVVLLADVFENFRNVNLDKFGLEPCHYFPAPGLTWDAALKYTRITLDLFTDIDMHLMIERGIRGGISCTMKRYARANNPASEAFSPNQPNTYLMYFNVNNLYGYAPNQKLSIGGFEWVESKDHDTVLDTLMERNSPTNEGHISKVDLEYPKNLHYAHNDYPLAPDRLEVNEIMSRARQRDLSIRLVEQGVRRVSSEKPVPSFLKKGNYIIHEQNLKYYLEKGMKVVQIHRILRFAQSPWHKPHIELCTSQRIEAKNTFEKDFWKLMVNSLYGKPIEDKRKHTEVGISKKVDQALRCVRKPLFEQFYILDTNLALMELKRTQMVLDRPIYLGFTVLELSKLPMFKLHYDHFISKYGQNIDLIYTDTDSFIHEIRTSNIINDPTSMSSIMDFSDYSPEHPLFDESNKKVIGKLKSELCGQFMEEIVAFKPKMYSSRTNKGNSKRCLKSRSEE